MRDILLGFAVFFSISGIGMSTWVLRSLAEKCRAERLRLQEPQNY